jgi:hypothetical protein
MEEISQVSEHWSEIEKTLPATANRAHVRAKLEQIARAKVLPEELATQQDAIARHCENLRNLIEAESNGLFETEPPEQPVAFLEELTRRGAIAKKRAATYWQAGKVDRPRFLRQCALLWLWETNGGDFGGLIRHLGHKTKQRGQIRADLS